MAGKPRIAVVSPFLDKRHGTERCVAEQVERLARDSGYEIHIYSQHVEDIPGVRRNGDKTRAGLSGSGSLIWHKVSDIPGPQLLRYPWWFVANQLCRWRHRWLNGCAYDLVYSPGVNCFDADVIAVHIVFAEFYRRVKNELSLRRNPLHSWPRILHRRLYYKLIMALERRIYRRQDLPLTGVSRKTVSDLANFFGRDARVFVVYSGLDLARFTPVSRARLRAEARWALGLSPEAFALLLVGNDWKKKGLPCLLEAVGQIRDSRLILFVVGRDDPLPYHEHIEALTLTNRVRFLPPRRDVEFYYAAADAYVGPSLEDAFSLPPAEAMACGLPAIVSRLAGVSEIVCHGTDGLILEDPADAQTLAGLIRLLYEDEELRRRIGEQATSTAAQYTWDRNLVEMKEIFENAIRWKQRERSRSSVRTVGAS